MSDRRNMIDLELEAYAKDNRTATYAIYLKGERKYLEVIRVSPDFLVLNHKNNRLTGQLSDHPEKAQIASNPESLESQKTLEKLLARTEKFKELKEQLDVLGQKEPGLITRDGLLVNGNTRVAALRQLDKEYVEVAVLPENITETDIINIEMQLQVNAYVHQDYTFTNELLFMRKYLDSGRTAKELAKKMAWVRRGEWKVNLHMRLLDYIEEVRSLSTPPIPYSAFDSKGQHLKDLDTLYLARKDEGDIESAESLKWTRLSMIFLGLNKDQVRATEDEFIEEFVLPSLQVEPESGVDGDDEEQAENEDKKAADFLSGFIREKEEDGLEGLLGEADEVPTVDMKAFLKTMINDPAQRDEEGKGNVLTDLSGVYRSISVKSRRASDRIIDDQKLESLKVEPTEKLKEIRSMVSSIRSKVPELKNQPGFKLGDFKFHLGKLSKELEKLEDIVDE